FFSPVLMSSPTMFFRAQEEPANSVGGGVFVVGVVAQANAAKACGTNAAIIGSFLIASNSAVLPASSVSVAYRLTGSAAMGQDYTNLPGAITLPVADPAAFVFIHPLANTNITFTEDVILTLVPGPGYFIAPLFFSDT